MGREARIRLAGGGSIELAEPQETERPLAFHQSKDLPPGEGAVVPTIKRPDGTEYSIRGEIADGTSVKLYENKVAVGYAHQGMVHEGFFKSVVKMVLAGKNFAGMVGESSCNLPMNRNIILHRFLDDPKLGDYILFLDTDIVFPPYTAAVMVKVAIETEADIVAVPYQLTNGCSTFGTKAPTGGFHTQGTFHYDRAYEIHAAGTGCMLISRALLERMKAAYADRSPWEFCGYDRIEINGKADYESDDYSLCHRANDIGAKIVGYTGIALSHLKVGPLVFRGLEELASQDR